MTIDKDGRTEPDSEAYTKRLTYNMGDHIIDIPDQQLLTTQGQESSSTTRMDIVIPVVELSASMNAEKAKDPAAIDINANVMKHKEEEEEAGEKGECRFCQDENLLNEFEAPCACDGSLKYAHRSCIQRWCDTKGHIICEICHKPYQPNYTAAIPSPDDDTDIDMRERWTIPCINRQIHNPLRLAEIAQGRMLRSFNTEFNLRNPTGGMLCGTGLIIFLFVLLIRDIYYYTPTKEDRASYVFFCVVLIIFVPLYIVSWIIECPNIRDRHAERDRSE